MNWETKPKTEDKYESAPTMPWDEMVKEKEYKYFTLYRKWHKCGGWYHVTVSNWELGKAKGKV